MYQRLALTLGLILSIAACTELIYPPGYDASVNPNPELPGVDTTSDAGADVAPSVDTQPQDTTSIQDTWTAPEDTAPPSEDTSLAADTSSPSDATPVDATPVDAVQVDTQQAAVWHWLSTTNVVNPANPNPNPGTLIVSHNALALFPLDTEKTIKQIDKLGPKKLLVIQTLGVCMGNENALNADPNGSEATPNGHLKLLPGNQFHTNIKAAGEIPSLSTATVQAVELEMPYYVPGDENKRVPSTFCYGYRKGGEWFVNLDPIEPTLDDEGQKGSGNFQVGVSGVDAFFILFDSQVAVNWIKYQASGK